MKELSQKLKLEFEKEDDSLYLGYFGETVLLCSPTVILPALASWALGLQS